MTLLLVVVYLLRIYHLQMEKFQVESVSSSYLTVKNRLKSHLKWNKQLFCLKFVTIKPMITPSTDTKVLPVALKLLKLVTLGQESAVTHNKVFKLLELVPFFIHIFRWQFHFMANFSGWVVRIQLRTSGVWVWCSPCGAWHGL